jgi:hypothetical protein
MESPPPKWNISLAGRDLQYFDLIDTFPFAVSGMLGALASFEDWSNKSFSE